ncbi:NUDIX domain-containing protein [Saccharopolyspora sp. 6V]|uniref:NUDIX domain-containing protein n=1 Tax=Saccharopolyspora sp. 6V TaxID=2877239 RepID=UPI001CD75CD4|nr:NUDIX domain-containing protein [Saccharopolyspora sp. 6V]MCA1194508.1 NUDIX domain-containing protein [Saccharopolyspora sp. 6V]
MTARHRGIRLVTLDVGGVLGTVAGPSLGTALATASPHDPATVADIVRTHLHTRAHTTPELIPRLATELALPSRTVRDILRAPRPLLIQPTARALLAGLRDAFPGVQVVVCSNLAAADAAHADLIHAELGPLLDDSYFSYQVGMAKGTGPDLFEHIARGHGVQLSEIVHVGDKLHDDVHAPLLAGCRALLLHPHHADTPRVATGDRYRTAPDLATAIHELHHWIPTSTPRPTLPVRAAALIRNTHGQLLLVRGPDDEKFSFPGGRCAPHGPDSPPHAAAREVYEELRLTVTPGTLLWAGWAEAESSAGENKAHFLFEAHLHGTTVPDPDPTEVAEYRWASHNDALHLLHPAEANRLVRITRGQHHGWQHLVVPRSYIPEDDIH